MTRPKARDSVCVVGAGISGLLAARRLSDAGREVILLEKSRRVGGRMASRRIQDAVVDHGAQFFGAETPEFSRWVRVFTTDGVAREWTRGLSFPFRTQTGGRPVYRGQDGMTAVPESLAGRLDVRLRAEVQAIRHAGSGYAVTLRAGEIREAGVILFTTPVPEALTVLRRSEVRPSAGDRETLGAMAYDPCLTLLVLLRGRSGVPAPGAVAPGEGPVAFVADNQQKGISPRRACLTVHSTGDLARRFLDRDPDRGARELLKAAEPYLGSEVLTCHVHRWRYGHPVLTHPEPVLKLEGERIYLAGDAFGGPTVEGAALSGLAAAEAILTGAA